MSLLLLAFLSGIPALVYQVIWTRQVGLLIGNQIEAISVVLVAFFGGLALGAALLGRVADRARTPLYLYGALEIGAGLVAIAGAFLFPALAANAQALLPGSLLLALSGVSLLPCSFLLGGTIPALLRSAGPALAEAPRTAAWLVAANTAGAIGGVVLAVSGAPTLGLQATLAGAGVAACVIGGLAWVLARNSTPGPAEPDPQPLSASASRIPWGIVVAAALSGVATLGYEVLATRAATLRLGSSLYAWGLVLSLFLFALSVSYASVGAWARRTEHPLRDLGVVACAAAAALALSMGLLVPGLDSSATGLTLRSVVGVSACVLPTAFLLGGTFPFLLRLGLREPERLAARFGGLSAINTLGGAVGSLLAPFVLLPLVGLRQGLLACAGISAALGLWFVWRGAGLPRAALAVLVLLLAGGASSLWPQRGAGRVLHVSHGPQATAAVVRAGAGRTLIVDGDPEASTSGSARFTEEFLAVLPLALRPEARDFLEIGLGSGITLGTATRFPLERIECVEIAASVLRAASYFEPDNRFVVRGRDPRVHIVNEDGRAYLARHRERYDVIVANTLHPWSVGATGLYSREYFTRIAQALRPNGIAVQWLPVERIGGEALSAILRTMLSVFDEGDVWWGAQNLFVVARRGGSRADSGSPSEEALKALNELGIRGAEELWSRRLGDFAAVREALGAGPVLRDDLPVLETLAARSRPRAAKGEELQWVQRIAQAAAPKDERARSALLWLEGKLARSRGDTRRADRLEILAETSGVTLARDDRLSRANRVASREFAAGRFDRAASGFLEVLQEVPANRAARFGLAATRRQQNRPADAAHQLELLLEDRPRDAEAWNLLAIVRDAQGEVQGARDALAQAVENDPFLVEALANLGLLALGAGDRDIGLEMLERIRAVSPFGSGPEERALAEALRARSGG